MVGSDLRNAAKRLYVAAMALTVAMLAPAPGSAVIDPTHQFVVNGGFETTTNGLGQLRTNTNVSLSIDGPQRFHDVRRRYKSAREVSEQLATRLGGLVAGAGEAVACRSHNMKSQRAGTW
ncbi:MAG: hypothetical protein EON93_26145, partial [Burkholderiales bacterium]